MVERGFVNNLSPKERLALRRIERAHARLGSEATESEVLYQAERVAAADQAGRRRTQRLLATLVETVDRCTR